VTIHKVTHKKSTIHNKPTALWTNPKRYPQTHPPYPQTYPHPRFCTKTEHTYDEHTFAPHATNAPSNICSVAPLGS